MAKKRETKKQVKTEGITVAGKRKTAIAKATIKPGTGIIRVNKKPIDLFPYFQKLTLLEPIRIAEDVLKQKLVYDINVNVKGGGSESQAEASRLAIAKALVIFTKNQDLRKAYLSYDRSLLVADVRRKEAYKPGDSKARSKRQKSYR
jgi:small subunit ribosomal protein S9